MKLLHLDSSILGSNSVSCTMSAEIVARQIALNPGIEVVYRDLAADPPLHLSAAHLAAWQGAAVADKALRDDVAKGAAYLDELLAADIIVIGAPMYNFSISSQLKAWFDRVLVAGKTFRYTETGPEGLAGGKKVIIASARGNLYAPGTPQAQNDFHEPYLRAAFRFIGIDDVSIVRAEGVAFGPDQRKAA